MKLFILNYLFSLHVKENINKNQIFEFIYLLHGPNLFKYLLFQMSFQKKQYDQKDIIDLRPACPIQTEEQLAIYLRKNFSLPANIYRQKLF